MARLKVKRIVFDGDRILYYDDDPSYHVIGFKKQDIQVGDTIKYEPYGFNFGLFVAKLKLKGESK
jgi:hypothetical protein